MQEYVRKINEFWQMRDQLTLNSELKSKISDTTSDIIGFLGSGKIAVCEKQNDQWVVNEWIKKAILLSFAVSDNKIQSAGDINWYDKIKNKFYNFTEEDFKKAQFRSVPGSFVREGAYVGQKVVLMPSFVNIGAYVGNGTMVDTWATIGSCAYIGENCHISGGAGIGGVLEPIQSKPVIIENNCFIGARSEIAEGVIVREGSVISMGVFLGASVKIVYRDSGKIIYGEVPPYSVVVPGTLPAEKPGIPSLYCAVIIKTVDKTTREKVAINEILRG